MRIPNPFALLWRRRAPQPIPNDATDHAAGYALELEPHPDYDDGAGLTPDEIAGNLYSIYRVPRAMLPDGLARECLMEAAARGEDVYAYASGGETHGTWCVWYGPLAAVRPDHDGRITAADWNTRWMDLVLAVVGSGRPPTDGGAA